MTFDHAAEIAGGGDSGRSRVAASTNLRTLATTPMKGGWRLPTPEAYRTMYNAWLGSPLHRSGGSLVICCRDAAEYETLVTEHCRLMAT